MKIRDLHIGMKSVNVRGQVIDKSETMEGYTRFGTAVRLANAIISDGTASIKLTLWNQQILGVTVGDTLHIENAMVKQFKGTKHLAVGRRRGKIEVIK